MPPEPQTRRRFVEIGGARLYLEAWGDAASPALLCLHGLGGGTHFFGALGAALAADTGTPTIAIDLPGSGLSPLLGAAPLPSHASHDSPSPSHDLPAVALETARAAAFSFEAVADLVVALARSKEVTNGGGKPSGEAGRVERTGPAVYLLGHSMGAILALEAIRRAPDLTDGLIIVGGLPEPLDSARTRIRGRADAIRRHGIAGMGAEVAAANFSRRSQLERRELTACFAKLFDRQDPADYAATADALAAWTARDLPPLDHLPCLVISGEEDRYAPPDAIQAFARTLPPRTRVALMPDCGHLPFLEQPAAFAAIVAAFLRDRRGAAPTAATAAP